MSKKNNLSHDAIIKQSWGAYNQWCEQWRRHAKAASKVKNITTFADFANAGIGKPLVLVANGYSFEENLETLKANRHKVDILACDKTIGHLIENGIIPDYCLVCDANVSFEKYLKPYVDKIQDIVLFANVCANPKWFKLGWKSVCFFVNEDSISSHVEFSKLSGCNQFIPAATNVSNCMVVLATQSTNKGRRNLFGYDKYLLVGFDYSWRKDGKYYSFSDDGDGKKSYMKHAYVLLRDGTPAYSSSNLIFSAKWVEDYIRNFRLPVVCCSEKTILNSVPTKDLSQQMGYNYQREDSIKVRAYIEMRDTLAQNLKNVENKLMKIGTDHWSSFQNSI